MLLTSPGDCGELDFTIFFSEDEMSPGAELDRDLKTALHKSKAVVLIVHRATSGSTLDSKGG